MDDYLGFGILLAIFAQHFFYLVLGDVQAGVFARTKKEADEQGVEKGFHGLK
jgi:hypothetical protein